jgi:hypothetical protein
LGWLTQSSKPGFIGFDIVLCKVRTSLCPNPNPLTNRPIRARCSPRPGECLPRGYCSLLPRILYCTYFSAMQPRSCFSYEPPKGAQRCVDKRK